MLRMKKLDLVKKGRYGRGFKNILFYNRNIYI